MTAADYTLYGYSLSSAAYRVRIALALKGIEAAPVTKQLRRGEHKQQDYLRINPQGFVPALALADGTVLTQSLAIIEYLEETHPEPALLPAEPRARARVRSLCQIIACDIHPLNNLRVLQYLESPLGIDQSTRDEWYRHWVASGFAAIEDILGRDATRGRFCFGDRPGMAGRMPGAPGLQRAPLLARLESVSAHRRDRRRMPRAARVCGGCA